MFISGSTSRPISHESDDRLLPRTSVRGHQIATPQSRKATTGKIVGVFELGMMLPIGFDVITNAFVRI